MDPKQAILTAAHTPREYPLDYPALAREALDGGFTQALDGFRPTRGYVVGTRKDAERVLNIDLRQSPVGIVAAELYSYVIDHGHDLRHGFLLGAWRDGDRVVIDLVQVFEDAEDALRAAIQANQDAIYDVANGETIAVDRGTQASAFEVVGRTNYDAALDDFDPAWAEALDSGDYDEE